MDGISEGERGQRALSRPASLRQGTRPADFRRRRGEREAGRSPTRGVARAAGCGGRSGRGYGSGASRHPHRGGDARRCAVALKGLRVFGGKGDWLSFRVGGDKGPRGRARGARVCRWYQWLKGRGRARRDEGAGGPPAVGKADELTTHPRRGGRAAARGASYSEPEARLGAKGRRAARRTNPVTAGNGRPELN